MCNSSDSMRTFRIFILVFCLAATTNRGFAQWYGINTGFNVSTITLKDNTPDKIYEPIQGFQTSVLAEFLIVRLFSLETGLQYSANGAIMNSLKIYGNDSYDITATIRTHYLGIPVKARIYLPVSREWAVFSSVGFYARRGFNGNVHYREDHNGVLYIKDAKVAWGKNADTDDFKPYDAGVTAEIGTQFRSFQLGFHYEHGISDSSPYTNRGIEMYNRCFLLTLSYKLNTKLYHLLMPFYKVRNDKYIFNQK
jgi:hypothetical protein